MRIIRSSGLPAVVLVKRRGMSVVAVPEDLPSQEIFELARLVLSPSEYEEFRDVVAPVVGGTRAGVGIVVSERPER